MPPPPQNDEGQAAGCQQERDTKTESDERCWAVEESKPQSEFVHQRYERERQRYKT